MNQQNKTTWICPIETHCKSFSVVTRFAKNEYSPGWVVSNKHHIKSQSELIHATLAQCNPIVRTRGVSERQKQYSQSHFSRMRFIVFTGEDYPFQLDTSSEPEKNMICDRMHKTQNNETSFKLKWQDKKGWKGGWGVGFLRDVEQELFISITLNKLQRLETISRELMREKVSHNRYEKVNSGPSSNLK